MHKQGIQEPAIAFARPARVQFACYSRKRKIALVRSSTKISSCMVKVKTEFYPDMMSGSDYHFKPESD
jgi:hypothetical protein